MPKFLLDLLNFYYSNDEVQDIIDGYNKNRPVTLRVNTIKSNIDEVKDVLNKNNITYDIVVWYADALILKNINEDKIKCLDIYKEGKIYLQSLSSMLPPLFLEPKENEMILDMAAAPGGKTTQMAALTNNKAMITAIEKNKIRADRLKYNLELQGTKKVSVLVKDARYLDEYFMFDKILLDAPCSGSGTLDIRYLNEKDFNEDLIKRSINFQKCLLEEAIKHLKVNGEILYSTCSILKSENEEVIKYILDKYDNVKLFKLDISKYNDLPLLPTNIDGVICIRPDELYEGFFIAKLVKIK